jgi:very-short-patch-repair endonuclease
VGEYRGREIPWLPVVRFHKEIAARAEQNFFSLDARDSQTERWSPLNGFEPSDLAGPWTAVEQSVGSQPFRSALEQGQHESVFLGGPCYVGWEKSPRGKWIARWRPLLYREVEVRSDDEGLHIVPKQGAWSMSPLVYGLLDRAQVSLEGTLDDLANRLIERAVGSDDHATPLADRVMRALFSEAREIEGDLSRSIDGGTKAPAWVLFAPTSSFSALTRNLMRDYERLESLLDQDSSNTGGLRLLEDQPAGSFDLQAEVLPVVPLNGPQQTALESILGGRPLTVVSGPPGCGKSQVVVALLLNAWANGKTILFASNNNKAVDVVRERLEHFESEFPVAVRAGNRQKSNIQEVFRRTINMASMAAQGSVAGVDAEALARKREDLVRGRKELLEVLEGGLPQRIDEALRTALRAYGEYRSKLVDLERQEGALLKEKDSLGFGGRSPEQVARSLEKTADWIGRIPDCLRQIKQDESEARECQGSLGLHKGSRNRAAEGVGLEGDAAGNWKWLISGPSVSLLEDWQARITALLSKPIEEALENIAWEVGYDQWQSESQAESAKTKASELAADLRRLCSECAPKLEEIEAVLSEYSHGRERLRASGIPEDISVPIASLDNWAGSFAEYLTLEQRIFDFLPWSRRSKLKRTLTKHEAEFRTAFPLSVWAEIGPLNAEGRQKLASLVDQVRYWIGLREKRAAKQAEIDAIAGQFATRRSLAVDLGIGDLPNGADLEAWQSVAGMAKDLSELAGRAATAWRNRDLKEKAERQLQEVSAKWRSAASGVPIKDAWVKGQGSEFDRKIKDLGQTPSKDTVDAARKALYAGSLDHLIESWKTAVAEQIEIEELEQALRKIPDRESRLGSWWQERPEDAFVVQAKPDDFPDREVLEPELGSVGDWCSQWKAFQSTEKVKILKEAASELEWATNQLDQAIGNLPEGAERDQASVLHRGVKESPDVEWPIDELNELFGEFSPERIRARIERMEGELERGSFDDAKARWIERLKKDDAALKAVDTLEKNLQRNRGEVQESDFGLFREALRLVPIWITTAQAPQAIPLEPELFDTVVIDEASQCTLTNLLPLVYRGQHLAVIGDSEQLPAIPTIQESEERALAQKHDVEQHLNLIGHATNDVYKAACESLPRRRADVINLTDHFRSNPQIIGFSNRYIYQQRLELRKDPSAARKVPFGSGVHRVHVQGVVRRGERNRSWVNMPEAEKVLEIVQGLHSQAAGLSMGVVTPFAAHKELLLQRIQNLGMTAQVLVDTAYGFQGDERDVIIFSPVVGMGITPSASRWVETPPNLVNVALTRAREALFVVADFDYCLRQEGILRRLAEYCNDVQKLRDESPAELELFSWMVVEGWAPEIHSHVGDIEVDFVLHGGDAQKVAVEVDGKQHEEQQEEDKARDAYLRGRGYTVIRIPARAVFETPFEVIRRIGESLVA